jgi:hypothetical protein
MRYSKYENGLGHHLLPRAGGNSVPAGANAVAGVRQTDGFRLLPPRRHALLRGATGVRFAICTNGPGAILQSSIQPVFAARRSLSGLDLARNFSKFDFFRQYVAVDGGRGSAVRAGLRPADLIPFFKRP